MQLLGPYALCEAHHHPSLEFMSLLTPTYCAECSKAWFCFTVTFWGGRWRTHNKPQVPLATEKLKPLRLTLPTGANLHFSGASTSLSGRLDREATASLSTWRRTSIWFWASLGGDVHRLEEIFSTA